VRAAGTARIRPALDSRAEHEVVDEQLRVPVEEVGQRLRPVIGLEAVALPDADPRQRLPLPSELVAATCELFLLCQERCPGREPLLARPDVVLRHPGLLPGLTTCRPAAGRKLIAVKRVLQAEQPARERAFRRGAEAPPRKRAARPRGRARAPPRAQPVPARRPGSASAPRALRPPRRPPRRQTRP